MCIWNDSTATESQPTIPQHWPLYLFSYHARLIGVKAALFTQEEAKSSLGSFEGPLPPFNPSDPRDEAVAMLGHLCFL